MRTKRFRNGISLIYSPINAAYFVMWFNQVLRIIDDKKEAREYINYILRDKE